MSNAITFGPQPGPQTEFLSSNADIVIYGGAKGGGKTYGLLIECLRNTKNGNFASVIFRRTYPQINQEGGLWDTSERVYPFAGARGSRGNNGWHFPSGATVTFRHMENEMDRYSWQGSQIPLLCFDQLETFTEKQFFFMFGVNRSTCGVRPYIRATCNPEPGWLSEFLSWWWDPDTGYAIHERSGVVRYFVRVNDAIKWAGTRNELIERYPGCEPKSCTFIAAYVTDNKILMDADPGYMSNLLALGMVDRERYLHGNWKIKATAGTIFNRAWFAGKILKEMPIGIIAGVRFWDLAHTPEGEGNDPDWTCSVKGFSFDLGKKVVITNMTRWRRTSFETEKGVRVTAELDGIEIKVGMEQEPAAGKSYCAYYQRDVLSGYTFEAVPSIKSKVVRAGPLSSATEAGNVFLLEGDWNADFIDQLEAFRGDEEKNAIQPRLALRAHIVHARGPTAHTASWDSRLVRQGCPARHHVARGNLFRCGLGAPIPLAHGALALKHAHRRHGRVNRQLGRGIFLLRHIQLHIRARIDSFPEMPRDDVLVHVVVQRLRDHPPIVLLHQIAFVAL